MPDEYKLVTDKEKDFADLYGRMDEDKKLLIQYSYVMRDKDDREDPDVDNITMNDAATFANRVHNTIIRAGITPEVEGEGLKDEDTSLIEGFIRAIDLMADSFIQYRDIPSFKDWEILQACDRGRIARRVTLREEDGKLAPDSFLQIDARYLSYEYGINGLLWVANRLPRSKEDIKDEYGVEVTRKNAVVTDFWNSEEEVVYVGKEEVKREANVWGEPPFIIQVVPAGLFFMDDDRMLQSGESIFSLDRNLYPAKNLFGTILQSLTTKSFFNGLQLEVENVATAKKPALPPYGKKFVAPVKIGSKGYFSMPIQDLQSSAKFFYSILDEALQNGALPKVSYGTYPSPASGVGIAQLKEAEDPVYYPRIQGFTMFRQRLYRMIIKQYIQLKMNLELGEAGFKKKYSYRDLDKDFSLKFFVDLTSPQQDMVNISTAAAVGGLVSKDTKRRKYLRLDNPDEENDKILAERASDMSPMVAMYDVGKALWERGDKVKAGYIAKQMGVTMKELLSGASSNGKKPVPEQEPKQLIPMFGGATGGRGDGGSPGGEE